MAARSGRMILSRRAARKSTYSAPRTKGAWVANRWGARGARFHHHQDGADQTNGFDDGIVLPHFCAFIDEPDTDDSASEDSASEDQEHATTGNVQPKTKHEIAGAAELQEDNTTELFPLPQDKLSQRHTTHLYDLPNEILDEIFTPLVITGGVYQFTPVKPEHCDETVTSIHFVHAPAEGEVERPPLQFALVSSRIRDIVYRLFYGQNQFVNEVAARPLTSYVTVDDDLVQIIERRRPGSFGKTRMLFETWCRLYSPTVQDVVGPLTTNILRHVSNLTICIVPDTKESSSESKSIRQQLERIASAFSGYDKRALKRLTISFETLLPFLASKYDREAGYRDRFLTHHLHIKRAEGGHGLEMVADRTPSRTICEFSGVHVRILTGVMQRYSAKFEESVANLQDVLAPLLCLEGVKIDSGLATDDESEGEYTTDDDESESEESNDDGESDDDDEPSDDESEDDVPNVEEAIDDEAIDDEANGGVEANGDGSDDTESRAAKKQRRW